MLHETLIWGRQPLTAPIIQDTLLSKTANPIALAVSMMGGGLISPYEQDLSWVLLPPPLYICYKLFNTGENTLQSL